MKNDATLSIPDRSISGCPLRQPGHERVLLGSDYSIGWTGSAYQELSTAGTGYQGFLFGLVMVFLILAAQYERWSLPLAVLTAVPFALFGAILAIWARGLENDIYFQIGLVTLIGLAAKNAILIVEFAAERHQAGLSVFDAALEAARLRFRWPYQRGPGPRAAIRLGPALSEE
jgi:multidrug efflux pump